jgi:molecular chaperone DnaJ
MKKRDYYEVLGVTRTATEEEIKKSYRRLAMEHHPDRNPGDEEACERFKEAAEAYEVLHDPEKRSLYDRFGHEGLTATGFSGFGGFEDIFTSFHDIFDDFFGLGRRGRQARGQPGFDLRYDLKITLLEAALGKSQELDIPRRVECPTCAGSGIEPGFEAEVCPMCRGMGQVTRQQGFFRLSTTCPRCQGTGRIISHPCKVCQGAGLTSEVKKVEVKVPPGVDTGTRLRLRNEGEPGLRGGPPGDLYVIIVVEPHDVFERHEDDLYCQVRLSFALAALGGEVMAPTLEGEEKLQVKPGTQPGEVVRFPGRGVPHLQGGGRGDLVVQLQVEVPRKLTKRQKEILREFEAVQNEKGGVKKPERTKNFWSRILKDAKGGG